MRYADQEVQKIAKEVGMIYTKNGIGYSQPVKIGDKEAEFQYETPDEMACVMVYTNNSRKYPDVYSSGQYELFKIDHPEFFSK